MATHRAAATLVGEDTQPLIAIPMEEEGRTFVRYFTDEAAADAAATERGIQEALSLAGAWDDLDWEEMEAALHQMRHEVAPTPPIDGL